MKKGRNEGRKEEGAQLIYTNQYPNSANREFASGSWKTLGGGCGGCFPPSTPTPTPVLSSGGTAPFAGLSVDASDGGGGGGGRSATTSELRRRNMARGSRILSMSKDCWALPSGRRRNSQLRTCLVVNAEEMEGREGEVG